MNTKSHPTDHQEQSTVVAERLLRVATLIVRDMHQFLRQQPSDIRVTMPQLRVLHLARVQKPTLSDVAVALRVTRPTATRLVDALVERGWLERTPDPLDRRRIRLKTTEAGVAIQTKIETALHRYLSTRLASLDVEALELLEKCLALVTQVWECASDSSSD